jgi:hypothetical protein
MDGFAQTINVGNLVTLAKAHNRVAFDMLVRIAEGGASESSDILLRNIALSTARAVIADATPVIRATLTFKQTQTPEAMKAFMRSPEKNEREAALDNYPADDTSILPILVAIVREDTSLSVLERAVRRFNALTKQSFEFWNSKPLLEWWDKNQAAFVKQP